MWIEIVGDMKSTHPSLLTVADTGMTARLKGLITHDLINPGDPRGIIPEVLLENPVIADTVYQEAGAQTEP